MSGRNIRVTVNISSFFSDHRQKVRLLVDDEIETIHCLQKKISSMFGISKFYLLCDGFYLHPAEIVAVLEEEDLICVMPDVSDQRTDVIYQVTGPQDISLSSHQMSIHNKRGERNNNNDNTAIENVHLQTPEKKRWYESSIDIDSILANISTPMDSTRSIIAEPIDTPSISGFHWIRPDSVVSRPDERLHAKGQLLRSLKTPDPTVDLYKHEDVNITCRKPSSHRNKIIIVTKSPSKPKVIITEATSTSIMLGDNQEAEAVETKEQSADNLNINIENAIQRAIPMVHMAPRIGDTVAFKVLKMNHKDSPTLSAYVVGKVFNIGFQSRTVTFDVISGVDQLNEPKKGLSFDDERKEREFRWGDLIEPRLLI